MERRMEERKDLLAMHLLPWSGCQEDEAPHVSSLSYLPTGYKAHPYWINYMASSIVFLEEETHPISLKNGDKSCEVIKFLKQER